MPTMREIMEAAGPQSPATMDNDALCAWAESFGARILWANDPEEMSHVIKITPDQLRKLLAAVTTQPGNR